MRLERSQPRLRGTPVDSRYATSTSVSGSLEELSAAPRGPDDEPLETEDLANHFLMEATQSSPPPPLVGAEQSSSLCDADASPEEVLSESFFSVDGEPSRADAREFERMWEQIVRRELAARSPAEVKVAAKG